MSAELAYRCGAAAAVLAAYHRAAETADVMDRALWGARLADVLGYLLAVLDDGNRAAAQFPAAAVQLAEIRLVLDVFDRAAEDRQHALELIDGIVNGGAR